LRPAVGRPADRVGLVLDRDRLVAAGDLGDDQLSRERDSRDPFVVQGRRDLACDERPVSLLVGQRAPADEAAGCPDLRLRELGMRAVEAGIDDRDPNRREGRKLGAEPVEGVILPEVVLLRGQRVGRSEAGAPRHRRGGGRERERCRQRRNRAATHVLETWRIGDVPVTRPWPGETRAR
jgi:hypothetical protein